MGRDAVRVRDPQSRGGRHHGRGDHRVLPFATGAVQGAPNRGVRATAQDLDRQDAEIHPARTGQTPLGRFSGKVIYQQVTLTAIDDCIARGKRRDWADLRRAALADRAVLEKVLRVKAKVKRPCTLKPN